MGQPPEDENPNLRWLRAEIAETERREAILELARSIPVVRPGPIALLRPAAD